MGRRKSMIQDGPMPSQEFCTDLDRIFSDFMDDFNIESYTFPADLDNVQRKYIHMKSVQFGIKSKSRGKEPSRILTITKNREPKPKPKRKAKSKLKLKVNRKSKVNPKVQQAKGISKNKKRKRNKAICEMDNAFDTFATPNAVALFDSVVAQASPISIPTFKLLNPRLHNVQHFGRLSFINERQAVRHSANHQLQGFRQELPIFKHREEILDAIAGNQVVLIAGETGSGKTTQVPQYILEAASKNREKVFIVCTQPRRISAVSMAERVSSERGESVGFTIGYQIKLESKLSPSTALIYCTTGVLLRTLMEPTHLQTVSHIIVDEIHERDKFSDFLMIQLRELLPRMTNLRVILMSATMDLCLFKHYFKAFNPMMFDIPGRSYPVDEWFLEEIIPRMGYENKEMAQFRAERVRSTREFQHINKPAKLAKTTQVTPVDPIVVEEICEAIVSSFNADTDDNFAQLMQLILMECIDINYQDPNLGLTALMVACHHCRLDTVLQLLRLNADITIQCLAGRVARDYALNSVNRECYSEVVRMLDHHNEQYASLLAQDVQDLQPRGTGDEFDERTIQEWIDDYFNTVSEEHIDYMLVGNLITFIRTTLVPLESQSSSSPGGILIFLPGYDDILTCYDWIMDIVPAAQSVFECYMLHGSMPIKQQNAVFRPAHSGKQKLILATNIAETSVTIADVRYVVDCGRLKEKTYDSTNVTSTLTTTWISKACAKQRAGRAGRTKSGFCFHIFTKKRYDAIDLNRIPEILRVPLEEICLSTKMLAPSNITIENYLNMAIQAPSVISIRNAITTLQHLGALDASENMTLLGQHLVQLSVDPHLGKMVIYASIFKCLDPVLSIVSVLAQKDPFSLPNTGMQKIDAQNIRKMFSEDTYSDHMIFLRAFQKYQEHKANHNERRFCQDHFLNPSTMEAISSWRLRLLSQLRAAGFVRPSPKEDIQELNSYSSCWPLVKMVLASGLYPNIIYSDMGKLRTRTERKIVMHAQSCLKNSLYEKDVEKQSNLGQNWVIFEELAKVGRFCSVRFGTVITTLSIALIGGEEVKLNEDETFEIDGWLRFQHPGFDLLAFRKYLTEMINRKIVSPNHFQMSEHENIMLATLVSVLRDQDREMGLLEPEDIGQKPIIIQQNPEYRSFNNTCYNSRGRGRQAQGVNSRGTSSNRLLYGGRQNNSYMQYENSDAKSFNQSLQVPQQQNGYNNHRYNNYQQQGVYYQNFSRGQQNEGSYYQSNSRNYKPSFSQNGQTTYNNGPSGRPTGRYNNYNVYANSSPSTSDYNRAIEQSKQLYNCCLPPITQSISQCIEIEPSELLRHCWQTLFPNLHPFPNLNFFPVHFDPNKPVPNSIIPNQNGECDDLDIKFPDNGRYFIIKPMEEQNIRIAIELMEWKFAAQTEKKLFPIFARGIPVILIFTVRNTFEFYGIARLLETNLGDPTIPCKIKWLSYNKLNFKMAMEIVHHRIHAVEDGQELEYYRAKELCRRIHANFSPAVNQTIVRNRPFNRVIVDANI